MLNHTDNPFLVNITVLEDSIIAPSDIPVCTPLQGKEVCCGNDSWAQMETNFENMKDKYKEFVELRKARIENITKDFVNLDQFINITDIMAQSDAIFNSANFLKIKPG